MRTIFPTRFNITGRVGKAVFKKIRFRVESDFHFVGHKSSPAFGLSDERAVNAPARPSFALYSVTLKFFSAASSTEMPGPGVCLLGQ